MSENHRDRASAKAAWQAKSVEKPSAGLAASNVNISVHVDGLSSIHRPYVCNIPLFVTIPVPEPILLYQLWLWLPEIGRFIRALHSAR